MKKIIPVILAGGSGTRLWPLSRRDVPKPFIPIGNKTLFASAVELAKVISEDLLIVINEDHHHLAEAILSEMPYSKGVNYLLEPVGRNTAPAIALALQCISRKWGDDVSVIVLAADHLITSQNLFLDAVNTAIEHAGVSKIALFGVKPTSPETGYGYLEVTETPDTCQDLKSFVENPIDPKHYSI